MAPAPANTDTASSTIMPRPSGLPVFGEIMKSWREGMISGTGRARLPPSTFLAEASRGPLRGRPRQDFRSDDPALRHSRRLPRSPRWRTRGTPRNLVLPDRIRGLPSSICRRLRQRRHYTEICTWRSRCERAGWSSTYSALLFLPLQLISRSKTWRKGSFFLQKVRRHRKTVSRRQRRQTLHVDRSREAAYELPRTRHSDLQKALVTVQEPGDGFRPEEVSTVFDLHGDLVLTFFGEVDMHVHLA